MESAQAYITVFDWAILLMNITFALIGAAIALSVIDYFLRRAWRVVKAYGLMSRRRVKWRKRHAAGALPSRQMVSKWTANPILSGGGASRESMRAACK